MIARRVAAAAAMVALLCLPAQAERARQKHPACRDQKVAERLFELWDAKDEAAFGAAFRRAMSDDTSCILFFQGDELTRERTSDGWACVRNVRHGYRHCFWTRETVFAAYQPSRQDHIRRNLRWAYMAASAINNCYLGSLRMIKRPELDGYLRLLDKIEAAVQKSEPSLDLFLLRRDALTWRHMWNEASDPSPPICNNARVTFAGVYWAFFPECWGVGEYACAPHKLCQNGANCSEDEFREIVRRNLLPVETTAPR